MLVPRKVNTVPMHVYQNNELVSDYETVLHTWKDNFSDLYNRLEDENINYDNQFYTEAINHRNHLEEEMTYPSYVKNDLLNDDITLEEVEIVVNILKKNKACGFDCITNECLKNNDVKTMLYNLFKLYFEYGKIPSLWLKPIIIPIPKSSNKDPHVYH